MVDDIQFILDIYKSYCTGGKRKNKGNIYNYIAFLVVIISPNVPNCFLRQ